MTKYRIPKQTGIGWDVLDLGPLEAQAAALQAALGAAQSRLAALEARPAAKSAAGAYDPAGTASAAVTAHEAAPDPHSQYLTAAEGGVAYAPLSHVGAAGSAHAAATTGDAGFMSAADKTKLNGIAAGATANSSDATLLNRSNHTGAQAFSTVTMDSARILGRTTAGVGAAEQISVGAGLSLSGGILSASGGSDPWTWLKLGSDVSSSDTFGTTTGLSFTAAANTTYIVRVFGAFQSAATTTGIGLFMDVPFATSVTGVAFHPTSNTALGCCIQRANGALVTRTTGVPSINVDIPISGQFLVVTGGTTQAANLGLISEISGSAVTLKGGRFALSYRAI